jgi:hypothetical protein
MYEIIQKGTSLLTSEYQIGTKILQQLQGDAVVTSHLSTTVTYPGPDTEMWVAYSQTNYVDRASTRSGS